MLDKPATTAESIHKLLANRWSPRSFDPATKLSVAELTSLAEAARWAPSSFGGEPWSFIFCDKASDPDSFQQGTSCLVEFNQLWAINSSLLVFTVASEEFADGKPNSHHLYDSGAAAMLMVLQAEALGLRAHQMSGFEPASVVSTFNLPEKTTPISVIAIGKQAAPEQLGERMQKGEEAPRQRKDLSENFFRGKWGQKL